MPPSVPVARLVVCREHDRHGFGPKRMNGPWYRRIILLRMMTMTMTTTTVVRGSAATPRSLRQFSSALWVHRLRLQGMNLAARSRVGSLLRLLLLIHHHLLHRCRYMLVVIVAAVVPVLRRFQLFHPHQWPRQSHSRLHHRRQLL